MRYRVQVELEWFRRLFAENIVQSDKDTIARVSSQKDWLDKVFSEFSVEDGNRVKEIEKVTNHDVKNMHFSNLIVWG